MKSLIKYIGLLFTFICVSTTYARTFQLNCDCSLSKRETCTCSSLDLSGTGAGIKKLSLSHPDTFRIKCSQGKFWDLGISNTKAVACTVQASIPHITCINRTDKQQSYQITSITCAKR